MLRGGRLLGAAAALLLVVATASAAAADPKTDGDVDVNVDGIDLGASDPGDPGDWGPPRNGNGPVQVSSGGPSSSTDGSSTSDGSTVPGGSAVPAGDLCNRVQGLQVSGCPGTLFVPPDATGPGPAAPPPNPVELAQEASDRLDLPMPQAQTSPQAPVQALVGLQTWLWIPAEQWRPLSASVTAGATTVTATMGPVETYWDMGEGVERCVGPGDEWRPGLVQQESECGYTYAHTSTGEPNSAYEIRTVVRYAASWTCTGVCTSDGGDLGFIDSPAQVSLLEVGERQSVVVK